MSDFAIQIENLSKVYKIKSYASKTLSDTIGNRINNLFKKKLTPSGAEDFWALKDISFTIKKGEVVGIIGKNGAGKSTLLKILSRITDPSSGRIEIDGRASSLLEVGTGFHPELSGRENIYLNGTILGMKRTEIRNKFDEIVAFSGIEKFLDTPVKRYSSGMFVRLAFAVAAHLEPEILIIDEVLAVGDMEFQKKCLGKMSEVADSGRTILFVSHNMAAISNICHRAILLENGIISFDGDTKSAVEKYFSSSEQNGNSELLERSEKDKEKDFYFTGVSFKVVDSNENLSTLISGRDTIFKLKYNSKLPLKTPVDISIGFKTIDGSLLFACRSGTINKDLRISSEKMFLCKLPKMPLKEGRYSYNIIAYNNNIVVDHIIDAGFINVEAGDYYQTGKLMAKGRPGVLVNYDWSDSSDSFN